MPNWIRTQTYIEGSEKDIAEIKNLVKNEERPFSFNSIKPIPKELFVEKLGSGDTSGQLICYITNKFAKIKLWKFSSFGYHSFVIFPFSICIKPQLYPIFSSA